MDKKKIIMDVDTGTDDACALVMAMLDPAVDLIGIMSVNGNLEVKLTTDNTLRVVDCCHKGGQVKVYRGADLPMVCTLDPHSLQSLDPIPHRQGQQKAHAMHSDHLPLPETALKEEAVRAVPWLIETLLAAEDKEITIVAVGPATNIGLALRSDERIAAKIRQIILMSGGDHIANATPAAEFNAFGDPEALEIILQSGIDTVIVTLDTTHKVLINEKQAAEIAAIGTAPAKLISDTISQRIDAYGQRDSDMSALKAAPLHDPLALCYAIHPEVLTELPEVSCHVTLTGPTTGQTVVDWRLRFEKEAPNCRFALNANGPLFYSWMLDILKADAARENSHGN